jgi:hypothetical protein
LFSADVEVRLSGVGGSEAVFFDFVVEGGAVDFEELGGFGEVPLAVFGDLVDAGPLHFFQGVGGGGLAGGSKQEP